VKRFKFGETPRFPRHPLLTLRKGRSRLRWISQLMVVGQREWDTQLIRACLYPRDAEEGLKIRLSERTRRILLHGTMKDLAFLQPKSAYNLALALEQSEKRQTGSSSRRNGSRPLYKDIWSAKVLPKVPIFAWRLVQDGLAT
jgi:hypothetical protein